MTIKEKIEYLQKKLNDVNIRDIQFTFEPYLDESKWKFQDAQKIGKRMYVFYSIAFLIDQPEKKDKLIAWLKKENIWDEVSKSERLIFENPYLSEDEFSEWSWVIERVSILSWVLGYYKNDLNPNGAIDFDIAISAIQEIGENLSLFFQNISTISINKERVFLENIFNELITSTLRDISFGLKKPIPKCDSWVSFERHKTLNWVRNYGYGDENGLVEWDNISTDT